jgi:hypothetical protein
MEPEITKKKSPNSVDVQVGSRVKLRRMVLGLSQTDLGNALGCTFQQVQKCASRLVTIAGLMKVKPELFFESETGRGQYPQYASTSPDEMTEFVTTAEGLALIRSFQKLKTKKLQRSVIALVEELAGQREAVTTPLKSVAL